MEYCISRGHFIDSMKHDLLMMMSSVVAGVSFRHVTVWYLRRVFDLVNIEFRNSDVYKY